MCALRVVIYGLRSILRELSPHYSHSLFLSTESRQLGEVVKNNCLIITNHVTHSLEQNPEFSSQGNLEIFIHLERSHDQSLILTNKFTRAKVFTESLVHTKVKRRKPLPSSSPSPPSTDHPDTPRFPHHVSTAHSAIRAQLHPPL